MHSATRWCKSTCREWLYGALSLAWKGAVRQGELWSGTVWQGMVRHGMARRGQTAQSALGGCKSRRRLWLLRASCRVESGKA
jgi:hypothetical protein